MDIQTIETKEMYSEVYAVLNLLGNSFITKLPPSLYSMIQEQKLDTYTPKYTMEIPLSKQNLKKQSVAMITLLQLKYWCRNDEERQNLKNILEENTRKNEQEMREKYSTDNLFKRKSTIQQNDESVERSENIEEEQQERPTAMVEYKESFIRKIINIFKSIFKRR